MSLFRRKRKPVKGMYVPKPSVDLRGPQATRSAYAHERDKKVRAGKLSRFAKTTLVVVIILAVLGGLIGFFGVLAYTLKSGGELSLPEQVSKFVLQTPLKYLFSANSTKEQKGEVVGLSGIPEFPGATFVFEDYIQRIGSSDFKIAEDKLTAVDSQGLYDFLTTGQSVYRLPSGSEWSDVQDYYRAELLKLGWKYEVTVELSDVERMPGEYYTKDEKGLHLYLLSSDIWYETVTKVQAEQGLHDKIVAYKAKQELVASASGHDLLPESKWILKYSRDWDAELQKNPIYGENNVYFTHDSTKERVSLLVLKRYKGALIDITYKDLEMAGIEYISTWLTTQQTTVSLQGFKRAELLVADVKAVEFADVKNHAYFLFLVNKKTGLYYVVQYIGKENPEFFEYIKGNLKQ